MNKKSREVPDMPRQVVLTSRRPDRIREEYVRDVGNGIGNPPSPPKGGGGGSPLTRRLSTKFDVEPQERALELNVEQAALGMSKAERQSLVDRLALSLLETEDSRDSLMWATSVTNALSVRLGAGGGAPYGIALAKSIVGATKAFRPVASFITEARLDELTVVERQSALNYLALLVVDDAAQQARYTKQPLGLKLVAQRAAHVRAIFDHAFPDYLSAGIAKIVFRRMASVTDWDGPRDVAS